MPYAVQGDDICNNDVIIKLALSLGASVVILTYTRRQLKTVITKWENLRS